VLEASVELAELRTDKNSRGTNQMGVGAGALTESGDHVKV
jgi:hypothetical protein